MSRVSPRLFAPAMFLGFGRDVDPALEFLPCHRSARMGVRGIKRKRGARLAADARVAGLVKGKRRGLLHSSFAGTVIWRVV